MWVLVKWPKKKTNSFTEDITDTNIVNLLFVFLSRNFLYFAWRDEALWWGWCGVSSVQCVAVQQFCSAHVRGGERERETLGGSVSVQHCLPRGQHCIALSLSSIWKISENICKHLWSIALIKWLLVSVFRNHEILTLVKRDEEWRSRERGCLLGTELLRW